MLKFKVVSTVAVAAALAGTTVHAQDTHTLTPRYPDQFKIEQTRSSDSEQFGQSGHIVSHTRMVLTEAVQKTDTGYKAIYIAISGDANGQDDSGKPSPQSATQKHLLGALTAVGPVQVTFDKSMTPLSIDNIDAIKPRLKEALTGSGNAQQDAMGARMYDAFAANLTPQSAAAFLKQMSEMGNGTVFNRPLVLHKATAFSGDPVDFMGGSLRLSGTATLDDWNEAGHSATVTTVLTPSDTELHTFMTGFLHNMMGKVIPKGDDDARYKAIIDRLIDNMHMTMSVKCETTLDLTNYAVNHTVCDNQTAMTLDMAKGMPPEVIKQKPEIASMPPMTMIQNDHTVSDSRLIP